jgi:hypothetical protein
MIITTPPPPPFTRLGVAFAEMNEVDVEQDIYLAAIITTPPPSPPVAEPPAPPRRNVGVVEVAETAHPRTACMA